MTVLGVLINKEFLALRRDIHGLLVLFVMPAIFILIMSLALKDAFSDSVQHRLSFTVVDLDDTRLSGSLAENLRSRGYHYVPQQNSTTEQITRQIRQGKLNFMLKIEKGFEESQTDFKASERQPRLTLLIDPGINPAAQMLFRSAVMEGVSRQKLENMYLAMGMSRETSHQQAGTLFDSLLDTSVINIRYVAEKSKEKPSAVQQSVPAWLLFAMFFVVIPISTLFIKEREMGTLTRLATMQVSAYNILLGKLVPYFLINQAQAVVMLVVGMTLVPMLGGDALTLGPSLAGLWLVASAASIAAIGYALLVAVSVRTTEQATTIGGVSNIIFAALGGVMVPKLVMPDFMQAATDFSPMAWGLDAFLAVLVRQAGVIDVLPNVFALLLFGLVMLILAAFIYQKKAA